jgi:hypothetical protein
VFDYTPHVLKLIPGPKLIIGKLLATVEAVHMRLDRVLMNLEVTAALRAVALPPKETLIGWKAGPEV